MRCLLVISFLFVAWKLFAADTVTFTPSSTFEVTNNAIFYGPHPSRSVTNRVDIGQNISWVITNVSPATVAFIHARAWANGIASDPSNEILYTNRNFQPQIRITGQADALALLSSTDNQTWKTIAVIVSTNQPLLVEAKPREFFRTVLTNRPPPLP